MRSASSLKQAMDFAMTYDKRALNVLSCGSGGFTLWFYRTPDPLSDVVHPPYMKKAVQYMRVGDFCLINASFGDEEKGAENALAVVVARRTGEVEFSVLPFPAMCPSPSE